MLDLPFFYSVKKMILAHFPKLEHVSIRYCFAPRVMKNTMFTRTLFSCVRMLPQGIYRRSGRSKASMYTSMVKGSKGHRALLRKNIISNTKSSQYTCHFFNKPIFIIRFRMKQAFQLLYVLFVLVTKNLWF